jgi:hypothetical protein
MQTEKGRHGHSEHGQMNGEKQLFCLWDHNALGTAGMKLGVLGYQW